MQKWLVYFTELNGKPNRIQFGQHLSLKEVVELFEYSREKDARKRIKKIYRDSKLIPRKEWQ